MKPSVLFLLFFPLAFVLMLSFPGSAVAGVAYVLLIALWWMVLTERRRRKAGR